MYLYLEELLEIAFNEIPSVLIYLVELCIVFLHFQICIFFLNYIRGWFIWSSQTKPLFFIDVFKQQRVNFNWGQRENQSSSGELVFFSFSLYFAVRTFCTFPVGHACLNVDPLTWLNVSGAVGLHISTVLPAAWGLPVGVVSWQLLDLISDFCFLKDMGPKLAAMPHDYTT